MSVTLATRNRIELAIEEVREELYATSAAHPPFNSAHEGHSVIEEEYDELWSEVKLKESQRDKGAMRLEARQLAAMALRFMVDCT